MSPSDKEVRPKIVDQGVPKAQASTSPAIVASKGTSNVMPRANWADTTRDCILNCQDRACCVWCITHTWFITDNKTG